MNRLNALVLLLDFFPGWKRKVGGAMYLAAVAAAAYNTAAPAMGLPALPYVGADDLATLKAAGEGVFILGATTAAAR